MRLTASLLAAAGLHGLLFGVAAAVVWHETSPSPVTVEVEVIAPNPDPVAAPAAGTAEPPTKRTAPPRFRMDSKPRDVALLRESKPVEPTAGSEASPASSAPASKASASRADLRTPPASAGGNAVVSASPRYRTNPTPDYPLPCKRRHEEGIVLLNVVVRADGLPAAVSLNRGSGHPLLDKAALDAVRRWTFEPGRAGGLPVSSLIVVPVRFSLDQR